MPQRNDPEPERIEVWPKHADAVRLFLAVGTQWRVDAASGRMTGLDYAGVRAAAEMMQIEHAPAAFARLRTMEREVLRLLDERRRSHA